ncbi:hypothetical protein UlMin_037890 [Ulmus minor]
MNPPPAFSGRSHNPPLQSPPRRDVQLQGPRPSPLKVSKDSHKIRKPPPHPVPRPASDANYNHNQRDLRQDPVIIYTVSPKVIHATVSDFMSVVQRLTGPSPAASPSGAGDVSPAARLASIEKTSPSDRERPNTGNDDFMGMFEGVDMSQFKGILSPAPATLPPISSGFFSPVSDPQNLSMLHDLSPFWHSNSFMGSPSASSFLSAPLVSPSPSSMDVFKNLFDF